METNTKTASLNADDWGTCPTGELQGLANRLQAAERRRQNLSLVRVAAGTMATTAALVLAVGLMVGDRSVPELAGISCADCKANFIAYYDHLNEGKTIAPGMADEMAAHLKGCDWCRNSFENKYPGALKQHSVLSAARTPTLDAAAVERKSVKPSLGYAAAF